jgi:hypothetical protein
MLADTSFESMSNEELIALIGYVKPQESAKFMRELESRKPTFTPKEKKQYEKNIKKVKR